MTDTIIVGLCTYKRPEMLRNCLTCLNAQTTIAGVNVTYLVVDNDGNDPALSKIVEETLQGTSHEYQVVKERGISHARNAILERAVSIDADYVVFIDDDQNIQQDWLQSLYTAIKKSDADVVQSKIVMTCLDDSRKHLIDQLPDLPEGTELKFVGTGGVIFSSKLFKDWKLRFDPMFGLTGGEDLDFFLRSKAKGGKHIITNTAVTKESIPLDRATLRWQLKRSFTGGMCVSRVMLKNKGTTFYYKKYFFRSLWRVIKFPIDMLLCAMLPKKNTIKTLKGLYYSCGCICCATGLKYKFYTETTGA